MPRAHVKEGVVAGVCNPMPMGRWEVKTGKATEAPRPASLAHAVVKERPCLK